MMINGRFVTTPTLTEVFEYHADKVGAQLRVCSVGEIVAYDPTARTASVSIGEILELPNGTRLPIPYPLLDVPVVTLQGGGIHLGLPVSPGDECLVVFNDFNLDNWLAAGGQQVPEDARQHDLSDGIAIVGLNSKANPLLTCLLPTEGGIASAESKVAIDKATGLVTISASGAMLGVVLNALLLALETFLLAAAADTGLIAVAPATATAAGIAATAVGAAIAALAAMLS